MQLSKIEKISLREVWKNEALDFTTWLVPCTFDTYLCWCYRHLWTQAAGEGQGRDSAKPRWVICSDSAAEW